MMHIDGHHPVKQARPIRARPKPIPPTWSHGKGLRGRMRTIIQQTRDTLAGLPQVLRLVWGASRPLTLLLAISTIISGIIPATQAYTAKLLINAVVKAIFLH